MQAWNQVKSIAGDFSGRAGVVFEVIKDRITVIFDGEESPVVVAIDELEFLG